MGGVGKRLCVLLVLVGKGDLELQAGEEALGAVVECHACVDGRVDSGVGSLFMWFCDTGVETTFTVILYVVNQKVARLVT